MDFIYGMDGIMGIKYNGTVYYFRKNLMGDVTHIYNSSNILQARYIYDAWGNHKIVDISGNEITDENNIGIINPIRYRGYYYDKETGLYYLKSRYYDPVIRRFISQDDISFLAPNHITGLNLYAYCNNNPVMYSDPSGRSAILVGLAIIGISALIGTTIGAVSSGLSYAATAGDSYTKQGLIGAIVGGAVSGFITGAISGVLALPGINLTLGAVVGIGAITGLGAGFVGSVANDFVSSGFNTNVFRNGNTWLNAIVSGIYGAAFGAIGGLVTGPISNPSLSGLTGSALQKATAKLWRGFVSGIPMGIVSDFTLEFMRWYTELYIKYYDEQFKKIPA